MNNCDGWCRNSRSAEDYRAVIEQVILVLQGKYQQLSASLRHEMETAAEGLEFERAAGIRDRLRAIENLEKKQLVTAAAMSDTDVIGYYQNETKCCFAVLHFIKGNLVEKEYELLHPGDNREDTVSALVKQYYLQRNCVPKEILLPCEMDDATLFSDLLMERLGKRVRFRTPQRGDGVKMVELACKNSKEEVERVTSAEEKASASIVALQSLTGLQNEPKRIESYDISHISGTDIVGSMVVFVDGRPFKKGYKRFRIMGLQDQDDYKSMEQVLLRRLKHFVDGDDSFSEKPDLILIDGGINHAKVACMAAESLQLQVPIYGMVKDHRHRTRALVTASGEEISIQGSPVVFSLIGRIQEETHRFAIAYHRKLRSKRLRESKLDDIMGIGPARKAALLKQFKTVTAIAKADLSSLEKVVPKKAAAAVYDYFRREGDMQT